MPSDPFSHEARAATRVPPLLRFLAKHLAVGLAMGVLIAVTLLLTHGNLNTLIAETSAPYIATFLFVFFNALTFASVAMGIAIMTLPREGPYDMSEKPEPPGFHDSE